MREPTVLLTLFTMTKKRLPLTRLQKKFASLTRTFLQKQKINQKTLASRVGIQESVMTELLQCNPKRPLSAYYLGMFLEKGVFAVDDIYDGVPSNGREEAFWEKAKRNESDLRLLELARKFNVPYREMILAQIKLIQSQNPKAQFDI